MFIIIFDELLLSNDWQSVSFLSPLVKRIDQLLQFDRCIITLIYIVSLNLSNHIFNSFHWMDFTRLMPSYNGILTVSCIRTLTQIALKLSEFISLVTIFPSPLLFSFLKIKSIYLLCFFLQDRIIDLIKPFCSSKPQWQVRIEAFRSLLDLEYHCKGIDAALILFVKYLEEEPSLRGWE